MCLVWTDGWIDVQIQKAHTVYRIASHVDVLDRQLAKKKKPGTFELDFGMKTK